MAFKALTVNTPVEEPAHILAEDDATLYDTIIGADCVLPVGSLFNASIISNNTIRLSDGMVVVGGHVGRIIKGDYEDMAIANGVSEQNRNDLIVARFISGGTGGADTYSLVVVQGTPGSSAKDPEIIQGDLYAGDEQRDCPLWRVRLEGLSVVGLDKLYEVGTLLPGKVNVADVIDNITTAEKKKPLSANQGKILGSWIGTLSALKTAVKTNLVNAINELVDKKFNITNVINNLTTTASGYALDARQGKALNDRVNQLNSTLTNNIHTCIQGVKQTGTGGRIYAQKNGDFIDIDIVLTGCSVGNAYTWFNVGYVDVKSLGVTATEYAFGQAYYSGGGPAYGDEGGQATIKTDAQSSGRIQLQAQCSKTMASGKYFIATIHVPIQ